MWGLKKDKKQIKDKKPKTVEDLIIFDPEKDQELLCAIQRWLYSSPFIYFILIIPISIWPGILVPFGLDHVIDFLKTTIFSIQYKNLLFQGPRSMAERYNTVHIFSMLFLVVNSIIGLVIVWPKLRSREPYHQNKKQITDELTNFCLIFAFLFLFMFFYTYFPFSYTYFSNNQGGITAGNFGLYMLIFLFGCLLYFCALSSIATSVLLFEYLHFHKKEKQ